LEPKGRHSTRAQLARLPAPLQAVYEKSRLLILQRLKAFLDKVDDSLFELADKAQSNQEQNVFFEAMRSIRVQRQGMEKAVSIALNTAFFDLTSAKPKPAAKPPEPSTTETLSLVKNDDLEAMVAIQSSVSKASAGFAEHLQLMSLRMDSLVPQKVYQSNNPIGPEVLCNAFAEEAKKLDVDVKAKLVLFKLFDRDFLCTLEEVYIAVNQLLVDHGVLPSLSTHSRARRPASRAPSKSSVQQGAQDDVELAEASENPQSEEVIAALQSLFGGQLVRSSLSTGANQLLAAFSEEQKKWDSENDPNSTLNVQRLLQQIKDSQQSSGLSIGRMDEEVINLVNMLFDFILEDSNLAEPMKALISRMQIPLIKVALVDKSFFTRGGHAARRLLNEMATAAIGWQAGKLEDNKDPLYKKMESIIAKLVGDFETDTGLFTDLLDDFNSFLEKEKRRAAVIERRTIDAEDGKAKAELARAIVATEIELRTYNKTFPEAVIKMVYDAWQNALFVIGLKNGFHSDEWLNGLAVLDDLLWTTKSQFSDEERRKLIVLVPDLVKRLRNGLEAISFNPFEMSVLLESLESVHLQRIRGDVSPVSESEALPKVSLEQRSGAQGILEEQNQGLNDLNALTLDNEIQAPFEPPMPTQQANTGGSLSSQGASAVMPEELYLNQVASFVQGAWFELQDTSGVLMRCRLAALIKATGKYIFVNRNGMKVAEKTQVQLAMDIKQQRLRPLDNSMLFDRALETVVSSLRKTH